MNYTLITGATSDIGMAVCRNLKAYPLILHGRNTQKLDFLFKELANPLNRIWQHDLENIENLSPSLQAVLQTHIEHSNNTGGAVHARF
ncbi:hypothetical protein CQA66_02135 [Helicobacter aurati]|uniref:SDR family NAD(P)-dependent oxidoreductase n=1 Tax=Helicobacter aurati TaxID=137778 RepID=A0A3D8J7G3_9HELI|nr:hypothetical protein [Helicobacter aurati]RDU73056.1 hypothetical protein CQA66_02135 [Helicobacter aurati]